MRIVDCLLDALYPRHCAICDKIIYPKEMVCHICEKKIKIITGDICMKCGKAIKNHEDIYCYDCRKSKKAFDRGFAIFEYGSINKSLYRFKYNGRAEYARFYATKTKESLGDILKNLGIEAFIPVPVHKKRYRKRGYNQAEEYANELSKVLGIPVASSIIGRQKNTVPLKTLNGAERQKKLKNAFILLRNDVKLKRVCVVDDIYTTGATIDAVARLLKDGGVEKVYFVTIAVGAGL